MAAHEAIFLSVAEPPPVSDQAVLPIPAVALLEELVDRTLAAARDAGTENAIEWMNRNGPDRLTGAF
ncbi:hypothetical protein [Streptomyces hawaiiensis]|uniref:hypothetical protein n=1 Tax=Streptomyces hawaiiensis TaxID=67305 RepID=UPI00365468C7